MERSGIAAERPAVRTRVLAALGSALIVLALSSVSSGTAIAACPNEAFRTGSAAHLPDCRAYEMVSPVDKNGFDVAEAFGLSQAAELGDAVLYSSIGAFADTASGAPWNQYLARRGATGWGTTGMTPVTAATPLGTFLFPKFPNYSPDLSQAVGTSGDPPLTADAPAHANSLYLLDAATKTFELLAPGQAGSPFEAPGFAAASADFRKFLIESNQPLTSDAPAAFRSLYLWDDGSLEFIGRLPNGDAANGSVAGSGGTGEFQNPYTNSTLSEDGTVAFFKDLETGRLYVRKGLGSATPSTDEMTAPDRAVPDPNGAKQATFQEATASGSHAFFTSGEALTEDATTGPSSEGNDLYVYEVGTKTLRDISVDTDPEDPNGAEVLGVLGVSDDGDRAYFAAKGVLAPGATRGEANLYLWEDDGSGGSTTFIASPINEQSYTRIASGSTFKDGRVSGDGRFALFNIGLFAGGSANLYDAETEALECVSCTSYAPDGEGVRVAPFTQGISNTINNIYQPRSLSEQGDWVFFNSSERLVPADTNDAFDVYRWREGEVRLISSGHNESPSWFLDADASGDDAFFVTRAPLLAQDKDELVDVYDARVGGGFPEDPPPLSCDGTDCKVIAPPPGAPDAASSSIVGSGNVKARHRRARCRKPAKKKSGGRRCVRRGHKQKHRGASAGGRQGVGK